MAPSKLPLRDQTLSDHTQPMTSDVNGHGPNEEHPAVDVDEVFAEELPGWRGYIEWENYPEKRAIAAAMLAKAAPTFPPPPEFQLGPIPDSNPVLEGVRWKMWHKALGGPLKSIPEESWLRVIEEKHRDMLHLLQFPYNGEPPKVGTLTMSHCDLNSTDLQQRLVTAKPITPNSLHFVRNHGGIPDIDPSEYFLKLDGLVKNPKNISLADLQNEELFPRQSSLVTIQCSGTRRIEQINEYAGEGDEMINAPWAEGAIGTAHWTGVSLKKVIKYCGGLIDGAKHLEFYGAETYFKHVRHPPLFPTTGKFRSKLLTSITARGHELCRLGSLVQGQTQRGFVGVGDERQTTSKDPRLPTSSCSFRIHWSSFSKMALQG